MKFIVDRKEHVDELHLRLNSAHINLKHIYKPLNPLEQGYPVNNPNTSMIVFEDSREIDTLIEALQQFRELNYSYFGEWKPHYKRSDYY